MSGPARISLQGYYAQSALPARDFPRFSGTHKADVCVIGAGYTGLSAALHLAQAGAKVVLLEAETVGFAASGRNGGQIHTGHRKEQRELERWLGKGHARDLWTLAEEAKALVRSLIRDHAIACDLKDGLVIAAHNGRAARELAEDTEHLIVAYGYDAARMMDAAKTAEKLGTANYPAARFDSGGGHLHPLRFARGVAAAAETAGAAIFEQSRVLAIDEDRAGANIRCGEGMVSAGRVIIACDAFTGSVAPSLGKYIGHVESFIVATAPLGDALNGDVLPCDAAVADTRHVLDYYRKSADGRLLFAGRESYWKAPDDVSTLVRPRMLKVFPALKNTPIEFAWSGTVGLTRTRMPHFGKLSPRILFAHGYSGHGVALATLGGKLLAEAAMGKAERFDVFARLPAQPFPGGALLRQPLMSLGMAWYKIADAM
jgi:gamma-glutamylputrescine oxidase